MTFGVPRDAAQWLALGAGLAALVLRHRLARLLERRFVAPVLAVSAALLSLAYVAVYLRGGPRIIDATSYWLEARAFAHGRFTWDVGEPEAAVFGRFLVRAAAPAGARAAVLFPPGYPAVLALGFVVGAPLLVGPVLAAGIVLATHALAARVVRGDSALRTAPAIAAVLSTVCAALRYHTADTMAHGLAALCVAAALACAFAAVDALEGNGSQALTYGAAAGLAAGWLVATRPVSGAALFAALAAALAIAAPTGATGEGPGHGGARPDRSPWRAAGRTRILVAAAILVGAIPGVALVLLYNRAVTGSPFVPAQLLYYAQADGPPGCFRYGFGAGIGCVVEHGDFVRANLRGGFGVVEALMTTLRRLKLHLVDAGNVEAVALLVPLAALPRRFPSRRIALLVGVGLHIAAYVPFYFDGNYPGGGARLYADVLPLEHVLLALVAARAARAWTPIAAAAAFVPLVGFAIRAGFDHAMLRDRDGGEPMLVGARLEHAGVSRGLVFVDTDHGFNTGYDPFDPAAPLAFARYRGDDTDWMAWLARGKPAAYRYRFEPLGAGGANVRLEPYAIEQTGRIEGESLWPPRRQTGGWAAVEWAQGTCASNGRWLSIEAAGVADAEVEVTLPTVSLRGRTIAPWVAVLGAPSGEVQIRNRGAVAHVWALVRADAEPPVPNAGQVALPKCVSAGNFTVPAEASDLALVLVRRGQTRPEAVFALDRVEIRGP